VEAFLIWSRLTRDSIDHFEIKSKLKEILPSESPLDLEFRGPAAKSFVAGIGEEAKKGRPGNQEPNVTAPDRAELGKGQGFAEEAKVRNHSFGETDLASGPPFASRVESSSAGPFECVGQTVGDIRSPRCNFTSSTDTAHD
jgi:hypothetical protein